MTPRTASPKSAPAPDIEARRKALVDKLNAFARSGAWRDCPHPRCKRARACRSRGTDCGGRRGVPEPTADQWARERALLKRALEARLAGFAAATDGGAKKGGA
jgi:hypothetical protein